MRDTFLLLSTGLQMLFINFKFFFFLYNMQIRVFEKPEVKSQFSIKKIPIKNVFKIQFNVSEIKLLKSNYFIYQNN